MACRSRISQSKYQVAPYKPQTQPTHNKKTSHIHLPAVRHHATGAHTWGGTQSWPCAYQPDSGLRLSRLEQQKSADRVKRTCVHSCSENSHTYTHQHAHSPTHRVYITAFIKPRYTMRLMYQAHVLLLLLQLLLRNIRIRTLSTSSSRPYARVCVYVASIHKLEAQTPKRKHAHSPLYLHQPLSEERK